MSELSFSAQSFSGVARLFPVPNLVMFPHVIQPLHIFESRYRALLSDALVDDRLIALPVLASGWEKDYDGCPQLEPVACLGKVVSHQRCADGRSNILLLGVQRVRLAEELPKTKSFRQAHVQLIDDTYSQEADSSRSDVHCCLYNAFKGKLAHDLESAACLDELLTSDISLAVLTDVVSHTLNLPKSCKRQLLAEDNVDRRAKLLLMALKSQTPKRDDGVTSVDDRPFPPSFSVN